MIPSFPVTSATPNPANEAASRAFPPGSRYYGLPTISYHEAGVAEVRYLARRFCPPGHSLPLLSTAQVEAGERIDQFTARALGDPTQFWRVADANNALNPFHLVAVPGRRLRVPVPSAIPTP